MTASITNESNPSDEELALDGVVFECKALSADLFLVSLELPQPLSAKPGQFAMLKAASSRFHPLLPRPMSILSSGDTISFLIRRCGQGTEILTSLSRGDKVVVIGPVGQCWKRPRSQGRVIMVAGGVGLAPLLFAARESRNWRPLFLYGARTANELVLLDEIEQVAELRVSTDDGTEGHHGFVTDLLAKSLDREKEQIAEVWTCGPESMMASVAAMARARSIPCQVSVEARMACGRGLCLGCARPNTENTPVYVCRDGPVFDAGEIYPVTGK